LALDEKKEKKNKIKNIIGYVIGMIALVLCIYIVSAVIVGNTQKRPPRIFGLSVSYVPTGSMEPVIPTNSYILFGQASYDDCNIDDIIVYYNEPENKYIIHRVVAKVVDGVMETSKNYYNDKTVNLVSTSEYNYLVVMGDNNNNTTDRLAVTKNMVYGKYITGLGFMSIFSGGINQNLIFFILIGIFVVMIAMQSIQFVLKKKTDDAKKQNEQTREQMLEELKQEILAEELAKLKAKKQQTTNNESVKLEDSTVETNEVEPESNSEDTIEESSDSDNESA